MERIHSLNNFSVVFADSKNDKFGVPMGSNLRIDASEQGNEFRFIEHNNEKEPNVFYQQVDGVLLVLASRKISKGEQIIAKEYQLQLAETSSPLNR